MSSRTIAKGGPRPAKHVPQRTCAGCGNILPKRDLLRIVKTVQGVAEVDAAGRKAGRGVYLCSNLACRENGLKKGRLDRALRTQIGAENLAALKRDIEALNGPRSSQAG